MTNRNWMGSAFLLVLCACSTQNDKPAKLSARDEVIVAALNGIEDGRQDWKIRRVDPILKLNWFQRTYGDLYDHRACVRMSVAGNPEDMRLPRDKTSKLPRRDISPSVLPKHVRPDGFGSFCVAHVELTNPLITGNEAHIGVSYSCGGLCGGGYILTLRKSGAKWSEVSKQLMWAS